MPDQQQEELLLSGGPTSKNVRGLEHHEAMADAVCTTLVAAKSDAEKVAKVLGKPHLSWDGSERSEPTKPDRVMGWVATVEGTDWCFVNLMTKHPGVPSVYSDFMEEDLYLPYDPECYLPDMDQAARDLKIPDAPLMRFTPLTVAARLSERLDADAIAIWALEDWQLIGGALIRSGTIEQVVSKRCEESQGIERHRQDGDITTGVSGFDAVNEFVKKHRVTFPRSAVDLNPEHVEKEDHISEIWSVSVRDEDLATSERWSAFVALHGTDLPL